MKTHMQYQCLHRILIDFACSRTIHVVLSFFSSYNLITMSTGQYAVALFENYVISVIPVKWKFKDDGKLFVTGLLHDSVLLPMRYQIQSGLFGLSWELWLAEVGMEFESYVGLLIVALIYQFFFTLSVYALKTMVTVALKKLKDRNEMFNL